MGSISHNMVSEHTNLKGNEKGIERYVAAKRPRSREGKGKRGGSTEQKRIMEIKLKGRPE